MPVTTENFDNVLSYHAPTPEKEKAYRDIRGSARLFTLAILSNTPVCADQQAAIRHIREAVMTANAAIALDGAV